MGKIMLNYNWLILNVGRCGTICCFIMLTRSGETDDACMEKVLGIIEDEMRIENAKRDMR